MNFAIPTKYVTKLIQQTDINLTQLNIKSVPKKNNQNNLGKGVKEGLEIINIEWEYGSRLVGFSIKNTLPSEVKNISLLMILKNSEGIPIDYKEFSPLNYKESIRPFLSKYIALKDVNPFYFNERIYNKKKGEKMEFRILNFTIKE